jgi:hypothetical protein
LLSGHEISSLFHHILSPLPTPIASQGLKAMGLPNHGLELLKTYVKINVFSDKLTISGISLQ